MATPSLLQRILAIFHLSKQPQSNLLTENNTANNIKLDIARGGLKPGMNPTASPAAQPAIRPTASPSAMPIQPSPQPSMVPTAPASKPTQIPIKQYDSLIQQTAKKYGFNPKLIKAIIQTESNAGPDLVNPYAKRVEPPSRSYPQGVTSYGLAQILEPTARSLGHKGTSDQLYDPAVSIDLLGRYLKNASETYPTANFADPVSIYRIYNTGKPSGTFAPGAEAAFRKNYGL